MAQVQVREFYAQLPESIFTNPDIKPIDIRLYGMLDLLAGQRQFWYGTVREIVAKFHDLYDRSTIYQSLNRLQRFEYIATEKRFDGQINFIVLARTKTLEKLPNKHFGASTKIDTKSTKIDTKSTKIDESSITTDPTTDPPFASACADAREGDERTRRTDEIKAVFASLVHQSPRTQRESVQWSIVANSFYAAGITDDEIRKAWRQHHEIWPHATPTPMSLDRNWAILHSLKGGHDAIRQRYTLAPTPPSQGPSREEIFRQLGIMD